MRPPAETTDNVTGVPLDGDEGCIEDGTADCVVDEVEAFACCVLVDIVCDGCVPVDGRCAECLDDLSLVRGDSREDFCAARESNLNRGVAYATCPGVDQDRLVGAYIGSVDQAFPCSNGDEWSAAAWRMVSALGLCARRDKSAAMYSARVPCRPATPPTMP